jgi:predicted transcriptional regulator
MFTKKDRKIANLRAMVANRDRAIIKLKFQVLEEVVKNEELQKINEDHQKLNGELREKIKTLENNLDFMINNSSIEKRGLN